MFGIDSKKKEQEAALENVMLELRESVRTCDEDAIRHVRNATSHLMGLHKGNIDKYFEDPLRGEINNCDNRPEYRNIHDRVRNCDSSLRNLKTGGMKL